MAIRIQAADATTQGSIQFPRATLTMATKKHELASQDSLVAGVSIEQQILFIRGQRVILASDLAAMYGVAVRQLNQAVARNSERFPEDFVFQLTKDETAAIARHLVEMGTQNLKSQIVTSSWGGARRALPYAFTEHGVLMAANLLRSERAVKVSIYVVRAFVKLRELLSNHRELAQKLGELESKLQDHDQQIIALVGAIRSLMAEPASRTKTPIGFITEAKRKRGKAKGARIP
ncbi:MAG TPA: ORF6N domain-containing protein [Tepidisphaeraceae bacterium]